jgi:hypothetical protein
MLGRPPKSPEGGLYCQANESPASFYKMVLDHFRESEDNKWNNIPQLYLGI